MRSRLMASLSPVLAAAFAPAVLVQPQDIEDDSYELRLSSNDAGPARVDGRRATSSSAMRSRSRRQLKADTATGPAARSRNRCACERTIDDSLGAARCIRRGHLRCSRDGARADARRPLLRLRQVGGDRDDRAGSRRSRSTVAPPTTVRVRRGRLWYRRSTSRTALSERALVYAQANEGFRPGGANQVVGLPERVDALRSRLALELRARC